MIYKNFFLKKWAKDYIGIDIWESPEYNKDYIVYPWWLLPIWDNEFDVVISTQVFEHLDNPTLYWKELERVTKNNGYLFISIAHVWEYHPYPKHYYNVCFDAIPLIFKNCKIIEVKWDVTNIQNSFQMLNASICKKNFVVWVWFATIINSLIYICSKLRICKIEPSDYFNNSLTWNILITLKVTK